MKSTVFLTRGGFGNGDFRRTVEKLKGYVIDAYSLLE